MQKGLEYAKARQLALRRAYPDSFEDEHEDLGYFDEEVAGSSRMGPPVSMPGSPRYADAKTPG